MRVLLPYENVRENPEVSPWIIAGVIAVALGAVAYFVTRPVIVSTVTPGHTYQITGSIPPGYGGFISGMIASMTGGGSVASPQWQNVSGVDNGNGTYTITGTYVGSSPTSTPPGTTVYQVG